MSERIVEQITWSVLVDRIKERIAERSEDANVPHIREEVVEVTHLVLVERIGDRIACLNVGTLWAISGDSLST